MNQILRGCVRYHDRYHGINGSGASRGEPAEENGRQTTAAPIYLLDDDVSVLKATGRLLHAADLEVATFSDPHVFLQEAERQQPRVAVIDIWMPGMSGLEVQTRLKGVAPNTRVIALTSNDDPMVRDTLMENGASAIFLKPANDDEFVSCIRSALNGTHPSSKFP